MDRLFVLKNLDGKVLRVAVEAERSGLLLMQEAVYQLNEALPEARQIESALSKGKPVYYLRKDAERRGLEGKTVSGAEPLDIDGVVDLLFSGATVLNL
ncbi:hypothetical protein JXL21_05485 [Candidatus Bathyarchaeota archaeon]|nr:hypothetical protein [Candidatus Bathyarchaeota archaeon]